MKNKIWSEYDLQKRDEIAAEASQLIASSKAPRTMAEIYMPSLLEYEILPNIVLDSLNDDEIRQLAQRNISPPRRLSKAANFDYYSKMPSLRISACIMLLIDVEPGTPLRTQLEKDRYERILALALSYGHAHREPFIDWSVGSFTDYRIALHIFMDWARSVDEEVPKKWRRKNENSLQATRVHEGVLATIAVLQQKFEKGDLKKCDNLRKAISLAEIIDYIRDNPELFDDCAKVPCYPDKSKTKEIEPGLTKAFVGIFEEPSVVDEYERLTGAD